MIISIVRKFQIFIKKKIIIKFQINFNLKLFIISVLRTINCEISNEELFDQVSSFFVNQEFPNSKNSFLKLFQCYYFHIK